MATSSTEDDFHLRFRKRFKVPFRERIIPSHILPYLECLTTVEEEVVQATQAQRGPTLAADELFDLLLRRPNWEDDLTTALRNPGVGLSDLADDIDNFRHEISLRYTPVRITDEHGTWCCNGHCEISNIASQPDACNTDAETSPKHAFETINSSEQTSKKLAVELTHINTTEHEDSSCETSTIFKGLVEPHSDLATRREALKIQIMEKIWSFVEKPEDVPRAVEAGRQVCLQLQGIEKGSLLFKMKVNSLEDLERLRDLVRYGGMKKILDQEVIQKNMEVFKDLAKSQKLELRSIDSQLYVHEADIYRCKSVLLSQRNDQVEEECMTGIAMPHFKDKIDIMKQKRLKELLPPFCLKILEDPLLQSRYTNFLTLTDVADAMTRKILPLTRYETQIVLKWLDGHTKRLETQFNLEEDLLPEWVRGHSNELRENLIKLLNETGTSDGGKKQLPVLFCKWIEEELTTFFESLSKDDLQIIVQVAAVLYLSDKDVESKISPPKMSSSGFFKQIPIVKPEELFKPVSNDQAFSHLVTIGVLTKSNETFEFCSKLLRDTVLAHMLDLYTISMKLDMSKYEFLPVAMALFSTHDTKSKYVGSILPWRFADYDVFNLAAYLVTDEAQKIETLTRPPVIGVEFVCSPDRLWLLKMERPYERPYGNIVLENVLHLLHRAKKSKTGITIELLEERDFSALNSLVADWALNVFILLCGVSREKDELDISLDLSKIKDWNTESIMYLSEYLAMSKFGSKLYMPRCAMTAEQLTEDLMTGNFANIKHLDLSETRMLGSTSDPLSLRYMPKLQFINLHGCDLRDSGLKLLAEELCLLEELKEINISKNAISSEGLQELRIALSMNHGLTALRLQNNEFGLEGALVLSGWLKGLHLLEVLNISSCSIEDVGVKAVSMSIVSKVIRQISMRENNITENGSLEFFNNMKEKLMLEHLDYGRNRIFPDYMIWHKYEETNVEYNPNDHGGTFDAFLRSKTSWSHLNLWNCNLGAHRVFKSFDKFHVLKNLVYLCLQSNMIGDDFVMDVGTCLKQHCMQIRQINLRHNRIGNAGAVAIAKAVSDKLYLDELLIDRNQIAEEGIRMLLNVAVAMGHSLKLDVSCNSLARSDIERLGSEMSLQLCDDALDEHSREIEAVNSYVPQDCKFATKIFM